MDMDPQKFLETLQERLIALTPDVIAALAILVVGWIATRIITGLVRRALGRAQVDPTLVSFVANLVYFAGMALVVISVLGRIGVNTASFAAVIAAAGLAIGLAFQGTLSNFSAGVLLIVFRPFKVGDYIEAGGVSGTVDEIQLFTTVLNTPDNRRVIVGNSDVAASPITNYSFHATRRVDLVMGFGYSDDIDHAKRIVEGLLQADDRVLDDPAPQVVVAELADSSVNLYVRPWVRSADYWAVYFDLTEAMKKAFDEAGIEIPFPQRTVHTVASGAAAD
ncbi:MAG: mechanosensitive ion channel [Myxococcota bacterium]|nr:mechanosensitive ion channel [Myxococcota bacterium]